MISNEQCKKQRTYKLSTNVQGTRASTESRGMQGNAEGGGLAGDVRT